MRSGINGNNWHWERTERGKKVNRFFSKLKAPLSLSSHFVLDRNTRPSFLCCGVYMEWLVFCLFVCLLLFLTLLFFLLDRWLLCLLHAIKILKKSIRFMLVFWTIKHSHVQQRSVFNDNLDCDFMTTRGTTRGFLVEKIINSLFFFRGGESPDLKRHLRQRACQVSHTQKQTNWSENCILCLCYTTRRYLNAHCLNVPR